MSESSDDNNNIHGGDSDSDQDLFDDHRRQQNRQRAKDDAIYGVFYEDDNHDSYNTSNNRRGGGRGGRKNDDYGVNIAPQFVKGKPIVDGEYDDDDDDDGGGEKNDEDDDDMFGTVKKSSNKNNDMGDQETVKDNDKPSAMEVEEEEPTEEEKAREEEMKKKQEAANEYFLSLLKRGKGEKDRSSKSSSSRMENETPPLSSSAVGGLGFHKSSYAGAAGLAFSAATTTDNQHAETEHASSFHSSTAGLGMQTAGLGMQTAAGLGMPSAFGGSHNRKAAKPDQQTFVKDPNLGAWEKHTKGIGLKLLAKMGYKGSGGLGSTRLKKKTIVDEKTGQAIEVEAPAKSGISRPVEVVVRPNNLGLGYGNFKEATKLKTNQQIEAEVRGIDPKKLKKEEESKKQQKTKGGNSSALGSSQTSALPSVQDLMNQKSWKRGAKQSQQSSRKRQRRTIIPYQELLEKHASQPSVVIDMRGPSTTTPGDGKDQPGEVPLAEELLHNVSLLLNTYENKIHSGSHFVRSTKQKVDSLKSDIASMEQRQKQNEDRVKKLQKVLETIDQIEAIVSAPLSNNNSSSDDISTVQSLVQQLEYSFTDDEKEKLRFFDVLAPSLLEPVVQARLAHWDPLTSDIQSTDKTMDAVISLCRQYPQSANNPNENAGLAMMRAMFNKLLLPRVKHALESQRWDPIHDVEVGLQLYESICRVASHAAPPSRKRHSDTSNSYADDGHILPPEDEEDESAHLKDFVQEEIIHKTVYFKLTRALSQWKPSLDESGTSLQDRPDLWILPWLPHLDHRSILPTLLADCKRKLKSAMSFLQKNIDDDEAFCQAVLQTIRPWCNMFRKDTLRSLVSTSVVTRAANSVASSTLSSFRNKDKDIVGCPPMRWDATDMAFALHTTGLLSDKEFLSIIEGELLPRLLSKMHEWLTKMPCAWNEAAVCYMDWRLRLFSGPAASISMSSRQPLSPSQQCLSQDLDVCALFYAVLLMVQAGQQSNSAVLEDLRPSPTNFRAVLARRTREERENAQEDILRMEATGMATGSTATQGTLHDPAGVEARVRAAQRHHGHIPTFREVVEEFAVENDVLFQPRMGSNATVDGKQVFLFGKIPIYLDSDVVFAYRNSEWSPTSLGQLSLMVKSQS